MDKNIGNTLYSWAKDLFPICRSITGPGVRETLLYFKEILHKYSHHSAVDPAEAHHSYDGYIGLKQAALNDSPDGTGGNDARYIRIDNGREILVNPRKDTRYNDELIVKRAIFENVQKKAIVPNR